MSGTERMVDGSSPYAKSPQDAPARNRRFFVLLLLVLCLLFFGSYTHRLLRRAQVQGEVRLWEERVADARAQQEQLKGELEYQTSPEYVDTVAREVLGLGKQGDKVIVVVEVTPTAPAVAPTQSEASSESSGSSTSGPPIWQQWYELFTP